MGLWYSSKDRWYKDIIKSEPYETGGIAITHISMLDPQDPHRCPQCHNNSASIQREGRDIYCLLCGWRDSEHYNEKLNARIKWLEFKEKLYGKPLLLSNREKDLLRRKSENYLRHRESILLKSKQSLENESEIERAIRKEYKHQYYLDNKVELAERGKQYAKENKEKLKEYGRQYRLNHTDKNREYQRNWARKQREEKKALTTSQN